jgi:hypothetical protein
MASAAQLIANRENAAHSTGPRTPEGKARCSQNALRHGLTAAHLVIREDEREDFDALRTDLLAELAPQGIIEVTTFNDLLHAAWNMHRFRRLEAERTADPDAPESPETTAFLDRIGRYLSRAQRAYYRALNELRRLQTNRGLRAIKLTEEEDAEIPVIADINELTKQTQSEVTQKALNMAVKMIEYETGIRLANALDQRKGKVDVAAPQRQRMDQPA